MKTLKSIYTEAGAILAPDGIPLHFGNLLAEYQSALHDVIMLDRSHQGRVEITGKDRYEILNRISTNNIANMQLGDVMPTILTNANGRILERIIACDWKTDSLLLITGPGRGAGIANYLQKQIFFNDEARVVDISANTYQLTLHGPKTNTLISTISQPINDAIFHGEDISIDDKPVFTSLLKPFSTQHRMLICTREDAPNIWQAIVRAGQDYGLQPAGGLTYNTLRIRAGFPGTGRELSTDYIPLEVGLWDEVSFNKGCYTGQEIIARMESREQLAKTIVSVHLDDPIDSPAELYFNGKRVGTLTSSVTSPENECFGIGMIKTAVISTERVLSVGVEGNAQVRIGNLLGTQPHWVLEKSR